ncbi:MAG: tocopherol cyclase family protein [Nannocystaceae bacterium]
MSGPIRNAIRAGIRARVRARARAAAPVGSTEADNHRRWDGEARGHYEVWYLTCNHLESATGYWIRYTLEAPLDGEPYAQLWFAFFDHRQPAHNFAIHRTLPIAAMRAAVGPFSVTVGEGVLGHDRCAGSIAGAGHRASWDLRWIPATETHLHLPPLMYRRGGLGETSVLSPNLAVPLSGEIVVDGRRFTLAGDPGGQTHVWGRKHANAWAWAHCTSFVGPHSAAFEALTVRLRRRGVTLPPLTILALELDGESYHFTRFRHTLRTEGSWATGRYTFRARGARVRLHGELTARPEDMVVAPYVDPDGERSYCANTEVGDGRIVVERREGGRWIELAELRAAGTAHFELGGRARDPAIVSDHLLVDDE